MATRLREYAYFVAKSKDGDPQVLTDYLKLTPTKSYKKGELRPSGMPYKFSLWSYEPKEFEKIDIEESLDAVIGFIEKEKLVLTNLPAGFIAYISCVAYRDSYNGGVHFTAETIKKLAKIGLSVDCDIYCYNIEVPESQVIVGSIKA